MDRVAMVDEETFVTGGDNGSLSLWVIHKKKPIFTLPHAHGLDPPLLATEASAEVHPDPSIVPAPQPRWICALATIPYSDVIISGSWDGYVRAWRVSDDKKKIEKVGIVGVIPTSEDGENASEAQGSRATRGVVNDLSVFERGQRGKDGVCIVAALGKEHRYVLAICCTNPPFTQEAQLTNSSQIRTMEERGSRTKWRRNL
jgi:ribosomal RNA-processing protein 9